MVINWFGLSCFKITSGQMTLVTDPFSKTVGLTPPRMQTDIAIISNSTHQDYNNEDSLGGQETFVIDGPGEYDVKGLFVTGVSAEGETEKTKEAQKGFDHTTIYVVYMEGIKLGFLGSLKQKELTEQQLDKLGTIDILLVPVGGKTVCSAEEASRIIGQVEPNFVIPMHYAQKGLKMSLDKLGTFLKEIGSKVAPQDKFTIKKSEISDQSSQIVVLSPQR